MTEHEKKAMDFLTATGTKFRTEYVKHGKYFDNDTNPRDIYKVTLEREGNKWSFTFGQSLENTGKKPTPYSVLACLTKYDVGSFSDFCSEFGYSTESRKAYRMYQKVNDEYERVVTMFGDVLDKLRAIH